MKITKLNNYSYRIEKQDNMKVPVIIYANEKLKEKMVNDDSITQGKNVATCLPGIYKNSIMLPDAHKGYGFSIGGVAALDAKEGCITPGGVGFDINCGVRLLSTNLTKEDIEPKIHEILEEIFKAVPSGVGSESKIRLTDEDYDEILKTGPKWAVKNGYGNKDDLNNCEENGSMKEADPKKVSPKAKKRGRKQLGTLGAGNHFLEIQIVDEIYDKEIAQELGFKKQGNISIMIHCGSRGLGHQVCSDYIRKLEEEFPKIMQSLPEKDLIYAPAQSQLAQDYYKAMCASANYAWTNRHIIAHFVREAFKKIIPDSEIKTVYDVAHNIAKLEKHIINGKEKEVYVHRKGATRAFPPNHPDLPEKYKKTGQPVIIPGSMGTSSYVLVGTQKAMSETFGSSAHGAGRNLSRFAAKKKFPAQEIKDELEKRNIFVKSASLKGISEEAPGAYKDVSEVIEVTHKAGIAKKVIKMIPFGVIKG